MKKVLAMLVLLMALVLLVFLVSAAADGLEARIKKGMRLPMHGSAHGSQFSFAGRYNWRGKYLGIYFYERPISKKGSYTLDGSTYYPALRYGNNKFTGWYVKEGDSHWRESEVKLINW